MKVVVVGTGYAGLVVGACLADAGNDVVCADVDASRVERLHRGYVPSYEPTLESLVGRNLEAGRLSFTSDISGAVRASFVVFIASEPPPERPATTDRRDLHGIAKQIGRAMNSTKVVVIKSSVVTAAAFRGIQHAITSETAFPVHMCSNPGLLEEGHAVAGFARPERIVIGTESPHADSALRELYAPFSRAGHAIISMDPASAEITASAAHEARTHHAIPGRRPWES